MLTNPKFTLRVLHMLMHLSLGHVTATRGNFIPPEFFPQSDLWCRADSHWVLPQISLEQMKIFEIRPVHFVPQFLPRWVKKVW